jgi:hypothetical protein
LEFLTQEAASLLGHILEFAEAVPHHVLLLGWQPTVLFESLAYYFTLFGTELIPFAKATLDLCPLFAIEGLPAPCSVKKALLTLRMHVAPVFLQGCQHAPFLLTELRPGNTSLRQDQRRQQQQEQYAGKFHHHSPASHW